MICSVTSSRRWGRFVNRHAEHDLHRRRAGGDAGRDLRDVPRRARAWCHHGSAGNSRAARGGGFAAFDKALRGRILHLVPPRLIVQAWRAAQWQDSDLDSTLILTLHPMGRGKTRIELVQVNVPDHDLAGVSQGWELYYWAPWRAYLKTKHVARATPARASRR